MIMWIKSDHRLVRWVLFCVLACLGLLTLGSVAAQTLPLQKLVVPFPPGGSLDRVARMIATELQARTGQTYVVENIPGADGALGAEHVLRQAADPKSKTWLMTNSFLTTGQALGLFKFDVLQAFKPVIQLGETEILVVARPGFSWTDFNESLMRGRNGGHHVSCAGPPGQLIMACELLSRQFLGQVVAVPYKGELQAVQSLMGGHVDIMFATRTAVYELVQAGRMQVLATAGRRASSPPFEKVPRIATLVPGLELFGFMGIYASSSTYNTDVENFNKLVNEILQIPSLTRLMRASHIEREGGPPGVMHETFLQHVAQLRSWFLGASR
jgi:tripartite-type tricarboxylate transporter receptor subunit TctC